MKLVSDFHDYYDGCITTVDPLHIYNRKQTEHILDNGITVMFDFPERRWFHRIAQGTVIMGFCGELYIGLVYNDTTTQGKVQTFWSLDEYLKKCKPDKGDLDAIKNTFRFKPKENLKQFFDMYQTPCFMLESRFYYGKTYLTINPCLKDYGFAKVVDPWTAYQEVQMFVGNNLVNDKDKQVKLSDKTLQGKHGFDKMSFKKRK